MINSIRFLLLFIILWFFSNTGYLLFSIYFVLTSSLVVLAACLAKSKHLGDGKFIFMLDRRHTLLSFLFVLVFVLFISFLHYAVYGDDSYLNAMLSSYVKFFLSTLVFLSFYVVFSLKRFNATVHAVLSLVLLVNVLTISVQAYFLYFHDFHIDYLEIIMGREQRVFGSAGVKGLFRPSGMYNEPGTYSVFTYVLILLRYLLSRRMDYLFFIAFLTTLLTFSAQALISFVLFFAVVSAFFGVTVMVTMKLKKYSKKDLMLSFFAIVLALLSLYFAYDFLVLYLSNRFVGGSDGTVSIRLASFYSFFEQGFFFIIFGIGVNNDGLGVLINDTGFWFSTWVQYGVFGLFVVVAPLFFLIKDKAAFGLFLLVLLSKVSLQYPIVWVLLALLYQRTAVLRSINE